MPARIVPLSERPELEARLRKNPLLVFSVNRPAPSTPDSDDGSGSPPAPPETESNDSCPSPDRDSA